MKTKTNKMAERSDVLTRFRQRFSKTSNDTVELGEAVRNILPFEDYKVTLVDGNKSKFKAVVDCKQINTIIHYYLLYVVLGKKTSAELVFFRFQWWNGGIQFKIISHCYTWSCWSITFRYYDNQWWNHWYFHKRVRNAASITFRYFDNQWWNHWYFHKRVRNAAVCYAW